MTHDNREKDPRIHEPVMVNEVLSYLKPGERDGEVIVDGTTSTGGHALEIAKLLRPDATLIGLDLDKSGLEVANERLKGTQPTVKLFQANYRDIALVLNREGIDEVDGVLLDLGFSSFQIEDPERGFSFQKDGPLDMRMNPESDLTAKRIINQYPFDELKNILSRYGEEGWADGIAREIVQKRGQERITTTEQLKQVIESALPEGEKHRRSVHPATKTFQALRIAVNDELKNLEDGLESAFNCLNRGGVIVVISYHSLEDRRVKRFLNYKEKDCTCPPDLPICSCDKVQEVEILTSGAVRPSKAEVERNSRSRSARLRAGRKIAGSSR